MISLISFKNKSAYIKPNQVNNNIFTQFNKPVSDKIEFKNNKVISFGSKNFAYRQDKKVIQLISFKGLSSPAETQPIGIQMRIRDVKAHQTNVFLSEEMKIQKQQQEELLKSKMGSAAYREMQKIHKNETSIENLADSNWEDGQKLNWKIIDKNEDKTEQTGKKQPKRKDLIFEISDKNLGVIGRMPDEIFAHLKPVLKKSIKTSNLKLELSNIIAGNAKSVPTIGLRANLIYTGKDTKGREKIQNVFNKILNDPECSKSAMTYQPKTTPDEVLKLMLNHEEELHGSEAAQKMEAAIDNILKELENPENKSILLVGHCKPDGDTIGSALGLKNAISLKHPEKDIDCAIDDKIPGLFRHKLPGIDGEIKLPTNSDRVDEINASKKQIQAGINNEKEIEILEDEKRFYTESENASKFLNPDKKYDVVVLMDIPTPKRFTGAFKNYIENAKKIIYIDHHPHRLKEWQKAKDTTGVDMDKIHQNNLSWIAETVPAAAQMVGVLVSKLIPSLDKIGNGEAKTSEIYNETEQNKLKAFVASIVTGMSTDTGSFSRTANLLPEHMEMPAQQRPNLKPEGFAKWFMGLTDGLKGNINKKWLREEINYDIEDKQIDDSIHTARETVLKYSIQGKHIPEKPIKRASENTKTNQKLGLGIVETTYDQMFDSWYLSRKTEKHDGKIPETEFLDVQNTYKFSEVMNILRSDPTVHGHSKQEGNYLTDIEKEAKEDYASIYDDDRIAVLIAQDKKSGHIDEKFNIADQNGLRLSLRSQDGTNHAELLAYIFGGGGHGGASGGRVDLPGVNLNTPLGVVINGQKVNAPERILAAVEYKYSIMNDHSLKQEEKEAKAPTIELVKDSSGRTAADLITDVVQVIRQKQEDKKVSKFAEKENKHQSEAENTSNSSDNKPVKKKKNKDEIRARKKARKKEISGETPNTIQNTSNSDAGKPIKTNTPKVAGTQNTSKVDNSDEWRERREAREKERAQNRAERLAKKEARRLAKKERKKSA